MAEPPRPQPDADELRLPSDLAENLRAISRHGVEVSAAVDGRIRSEARVHLSEVAARPVSTGRTDLRERRWWIAASSVAAAFLLAAGVWLAVLAGSRSGGSATTEAIIAGDIDRSGTIDIRDAYLLARRVEAAEEADELDRADVNRDGVVTGADVERIAQIAVALPEERS